MKRLLDRQSWLEGWIAARDNVGHLNAQAEAEEGWRLALGDSPGALVEEAAQETMKGMMELAGELANAISRNERLKEDVAELVSVLQRLVLNTDPANWPTTVNAAMARQDAYHAIEHFRVL